MSDVNRRKAAFDALLGLKNWLEAHSDNILYKRLFTKRGLRFMDSLLLQIIRGIDEWMKDPGGFEIKVSRDGTAWPIDKLRGEDAGDARLSKND